MNSSKQPLDDQKDVGELFRESSFDDSVNEQHQSNLRATALQAFEQANTKPVERGSVSVEAWGSVGWKRAVGYAGTLAVCLIGLVAAWIYGNGLMDNRNIVEEQRAPEVSAASPLVAALDEVNHFRDEVSSEALFFAIAICEVAHEERERFESVGP